VIGFGIVVGQLSWMNNRRCRIVVEEFSPQFGTSIPATVRVSHRFIYWICRERLLLARKPRDKLVTDEGCLLGCPQWFVIVQQSEPQ
jgi:hypothetical protein